MNKKKYIHSYDGIRVIALLGVIFYHLKPSIFKSGYLGVVTFFVMAGYLTINQAMKVGKKEDRSLLIIAKIKDKIIKLYPPLLAMIFFVTLFIFLFFKESLGGISTDIRASILSIHNYVQIFIGGSYFENTGKLAPFTHLWALSLEIQVYILIFFFFYGNYKPSSKKTYFCFFGLLSMLSYGISIYLINSGADFSRVYYATETRFYSFSLGAMAALASNNDKQILSKVFRESLIFIFLFASIGSFFIFDITGFMFVWILPLYSLLIALLMILLRDSQTYQAKFLSSKVFSLLAKRSYHIYLWHFPIIAIQERLMSQTIISNWKFYLIFSLSCLLISELSYRLARGVNNLNLNHNKILAMVLAFSLIMLSIPYKSISDNSQEKKQLEEMKRKILENEEIQKNKTEDKAEKEVKVKTKNYEDTQETQFSQSYYNALEAIEWVNNFDESLYLDPDLYTKYRHIKGVLIGDSIASMSYSTLYTYMPNLTFDSDHSRSMGDALEAYTPYKDEDNGDYIVLSLGTNGDVLHQDIDKIRNVAKDKIIILNTIVLPYKSQEEERNSQIRSYQSLYDNIYLSDWYSVAKDKPELFFDDKIHPRERGAMIMSQLIMKKIIEVENSTSQ